MSDRLLERSELCGAEVFGDVLVGRSLAGTGHEGFLRIAEGEPGKVDAVLIGDSAIIRSL